METEISQCACEFQHPESVVSKIEKEYCISKIACVPLDQINIPLPWNEQRLKDIRRWATKELLMSTVVSVETEGRYLGADSFHLPRLSRTNGGKYSVADGIHRINRAKELGVTCVLAWISDCTHGGH
jgi:hypothetical protein